MRWTSASVLFVLGHVLFVALALLAVALDAPSEVAVTASVFSGSKVAGTQAYKPAGERLEGEIHHRGLIDNRRDGRHTR